MKASSIAALIALGVAGCAPTNTNTTYPAASIGQTANVAYGTILTERPVTVSGTNNGVGAITGAALGGAAGSFIGGGVQSHILAALGGAVVGGLAGNAIEGRLVSGSATEFIIREDDGQTISVVQTNESHLAPGQRVMIIRGAETRLAPATQG
jgi:outer membrane lipoprotein SlyB